MSSIVGTLLPHSITWRVRGQITWALEAIVRISILRKNNKSIIVWHDYTYLDIGQLRYGTLMAILDAIPKEKHKNLYYVSNTMSAVYIEDVEITKHPHFSAYIPDKTFSINIRAKHL